MHPHNNSSNKGKTHKHNSEIAEAISSAEKSKVKNPPGVEMPLEEEMSPAQLG